MSVVKVINKSYRDDEALIDLMNYGDKRDGCELLYSFGVCDNRDDSLRNMEFIRQLYGKEACSKACHIVISIFRNAYIKDKRDFQAMLELNVSSARAIGYELGCIVYNKGYQNKIFIHNDTGTVHLHMIINPVNYETGRMLDNRIGLGQELTYYLCQNYGFLQWERSSLCSV